MLYSVSHYIELRDRDRIEILTTHFDQLVRHSEFTAGDTAKYLTKLAQKVGRRQTAAYCFIFGGANRAGTGP